MNVSKPDTTLDDRSLWQLVREARRLQEEAGVADPPFDLEAVIDQCRQDLARKGSRASSSFDYIAVIEPDSGCYRACCPVLGDCTTTGATYDEAKTRLTELVCRRLTELRAAGQPLPRERGRIERLPVAAWLVEAVGSPTGR